MLMLLSVRLWLCDGTSVSYQRPKSETLRMHPKGGSDAIDTVAAPGRSELTRSSGDRQGVIHCRKSPLNARSKVYPPTPQSVYPRVCGGTLQGSPTPW